MSSYLVIMEISTGNIALQFVQSKCRISLSVPTPHHWNVGDTVAIEMNRAPHHMAFDSEGKVLFSLPKDQSNGWGRGFYRLRNERTQNISNLNFDDIKGWKSLAREAKQKHRTHPASTTPPKYDARFQ